MAKKTTVSGATHLSRFFRVLTSRLRPSLASVASSSSRWSLRRDALARVASSSASSSCRLSCFILALAFSILGKLQEPSQTTKSKFASLCPKCFSTGLCPTGHTCVHTQGPGLRPFEQPAILCYTVY